MPTTDTGPNAATAAGLNPEDYRDACEHCLPLYEDRARFVATPVRLKLKRGGVVAIYRHDCGHRWTVAWLRK